MKTKATNRLTQRQRLTSIRDIEKKYQVDLLLTYQTFSPDIRMEDLIGWQVQALNMMDKNSSCPRREDKRTVHAVYTHRDWFSGRTIFLQAIKYDNPKRFLLIRGVPSPSVLLSVISSMTSIGGWTRDCLIFDIPRGYKNRDIHTTLKVASKIEGCKNIWVFLDWVPNIMDGLSWRFFICHMDEQQNTMSSLRELPLYVDSD